MTSCVTEPTQPLITLNVLGYHPNHQKEAFLVNTTAVEFEVLRLENMEVVFRDSIDAPKSPDLSTGDYLSIMDFTRLKTEGEYIIQVVDREGHALTSGSFRISDDIYNVAVIASLQSFYYQRCGTEVQNKSPWSHKFCHIDDAMFYFDPSHKMNVSGGWHDAGDYNKFSLNTAFSAALLLYLYEMNPAFFVDGQLEIPESSNGIPDILDEASWALKWLLKMQDGSGGVFHKVSQKMWIGEMLPTDEKSEERYIFKISSTATADFSAVTAIGAKLFREFDPYFSMQLAEASIHAWSYLEHHKVIQPLGGFRNPSDVVGGEYGDDIDTDERQWAAIELYKLTNDEKYLDYFTRYFNPLRDERLPVLSWKNVQIFAYHSFLQADLPDKYIRNQTEMRDYLVWNAEAIFNKQERNNYQNLNHHTEYYWGSNSVGLGYAYELIQMYRVTGDEKYQKAVLDQLHYVLGRNPFGISMVTGVGSRSVQDPYHQFSKVGGSNNHSYIRKYFIRRVLSKYPGKNYEDLYENYMVNEVAINFTAVFLYVAASHEMSHNI